MKSMSNGAEPVGMAVRTKVTSSLNLGQRTLSVRQVLSKE